MFGNDLGFGITVALKDMFTQNAHRIQGAMQGLASQSARAAEQMQRSFRQVMVGVGMMGAGIAALSVPMSLALSTRETQRALGEMASLGIRDLASLERAGREFSNEWAGTTTAQFISASYDIKSAISNLTDEAVGEYTKLAALTARATKATTEEMSRLFAVGYGIYRDKYASMSDIEFAQTFSGGISAAVQSFRTTGVEMAGAIKNLGAIATESNVPLNEQLAILGQLQTTMPGTESGTLYKSFMLHVARAGKTLGVQVTDTQGRLLDIVTVIKNLQQKFPDLSNQAAQVQLKKALGSDEALKFMLLMSKNVTGLQQNIQNMNRSISNGTALTMEMARAMNMDIGSRIEILSQRWHNLVEILGTQLLPVITPIIDFFGNLVLSAQRVAESFPTVTRWILTGSMALGSLLVALGAVVSSIGMFGMLQIGLSSFGLSLVGIGSTIAGALATAFWPILIGVGAVVLLRKAWSQDFAGIRTSITGLYEKAKLVFQGFSVLWGSLTGSTGQMSGELARNLKAAGLFDFTKNLFMLAYRAKVFVSGIVQGLSAGFSMVSRVVEGAVRVISIPIRIAIYLVKLLANQFSFLAPLTTSVRSDRFNLLGKAIGLAGSGLISLIAVWKTWKLAVAAKAGATALISSARQSLEFYRWAAGAMANSWRQRLHSVAESARNLVARLSGINVSQIVSSGVARLNALKSAFISNARAAWQWGVSMARSAWTGLRSIASGALSAGRALGTLVLQYARLGIQVLASTAQMVAQKVVMLATKAVSLATAAATHIWTAAQWLLNAAMTANPIGIIIVAVGALGVAIYGIVRYWRTISSTISSFASNMPGWMSVVLAAVLPFIGIPLLIIRHWSSIKSFFANVGRGIADAFMNLPIVSVITNIFSTLKGLFTGKISLYDAGKQMLYTLGKGILDTITFPYRMIWKAFQWIRNLLPFSNARTGPLSNLTEAGASILRTISAGILSVATLPFRILKGLFSSAIAVMKGILGGVGSVISGAFKGALSVIGNITGAFRNVVSGFSSIINVVTGIGRSLIDSLQKIPLISTISGIIGTIRSLFAGEISLYDAGKQILYTLGKGILDTITFPYRMVWRALQWIRNLLPFSDARMGPLSNLTEAGSSIIRTMASGILSVATLPFRVLSGIFNGVIGAVRNVFSGIGSVISGALSPISSIAGHVGNVLKSVFSGLSFIPSFIAGIWRSITDTIRNLPIISTITGIFRTIRDFLSGNISFYDAGRQILRTLAKGIQDTIILPFRMVWTAFQKVRDLLPFSDARIGPLSTLTSAGAAILRTIGSGILSMAGLPFRILGGIFKGAISTVRNVWSGVSSVVSSVFGNAISAVGQMGSALRNTVSNIFTGAVSAAGAAWSGLKDVLAVGWESAKSVLSSAFTSVRQLGGAALESLHHPITTVQNIGAKAWEGLKSGADWISSWFTTPSPEIPSLQASLATGPTAVTTTPPVPSVSPVVTMTNATEPPAFNITSTVPPTMQSETTTSPRNIERIKETERLHTELLSTRTIRERESYREHTVRNEPGHVGALEEHLSQILGAIEGLGDRPITLTVQLDGRQIAQSVYRDMRQKRVQSYGTS